MVTKLKVSQPLIAGRLEFVTHTSSRALELVAEWWALEVQQVLVCVQPWQLAVETTLLIKKAKLS